MHVSQIYPSESPVAPCLFKLVVFNTMKTVDIQRIHWPPPGCGARVHCGMCSQQDIVWSLLRTSLVKIYSQRKGLTARQEDRRMTRVGFGITRRNVWKGEQGWPESKCRENENERREKENSEWWKCCICTSVESIHPYKLCLDTLTHRHTQWKDYQSSLCDTHKVYLCVFLWELALTAEPVNRNSPAFSKL